MVEEDVGLLVVEAGNKRRRDEHRIRDAVAALHEHRSPTGDAADDLDAVLLDAFGADLVDVGLERADDGGGVVPFPEPQGGPAPARGDLFEEHLVEGDVEVRRQDFAADDLPVEVGEVRGRSEGPTHCCGDVRGGEPVHGEFGAVRRERCVETFAQLRIVGGDVGADEGRCEIEVGVLGFEEEVAGDRGPGDGLSVGLDVGDDEFAADDLVLRVEALRLIRHGSTLRRRTGPCQ
ncbi:Uncharacterised protein [Mycobacteroides abscessus subsp. abscessus]|nr:Uncharacterised protein [Mycobacteroides abscessus subsp. abscessus]